MTMARVAAGGLAGALALAAMAAVPAAAQPAPPAAPTAAPAAPPGVATEQIGGNLPDGTRWQVRKPAAWNGTLVLDLDAAGNRPDPFTDWLLAGGYAVGGTVREPVGYDFPQAVENLVFVRSQATARWGAPKRTLATGGSRGAFVGRKALELRGEVFDGALVYSGGGAGEIAVLNNKLNSLFALKALVDPASPLKLVNIEPQAEIAALTALVAKANAGPQGRARLALAAALQQFALWSTRGAPKPAPGDYETQLDQIAANIVFATAIPVRSGVEKVAGGNVSWNTNADFADLLRRSGRQAMVETLYRKAGLDLAADLALLARTPRISADPAAVRKAEPLMTYSGRITDPIVNVDNDDPVDPSSDKLAYLATLKRAGTDGLFRLIWADGVGHGGQTALDRAVGFDVLAERVATGQWPDTSIAALRDRADRLARQAPSLGSSTVFDPGPLPEPLNQWDAANWESYRP